MAIVILLSSLLVALRGKYTQKRNQWFLKGIKSKSRHFTGIAKKKTLGGYIRILKRALEINTLINKEIMHKQVLL